VVPLVVVPPAAVAPALAEAHLDLAEEVPRARALRLALAVVVVDLLAEPLAEPLVVDLVEVAIKL
tara:strand:+ start:110 stop:304 length:195 start_codon:yes stop_codon:yes gene_type:complete